EIIACGQAILDALGVAKDTVLEVNTLGDKESRDAWRSALVAFLSRHEERLSPESRARLHRNPLRVLDSKEAEDRRIVADAPDIFAHLTEAARAHWEALLKWLAVFGVPYRVNPRIVRGLDYYSHSAFEFVTDRLGAQGTVMAGGRYDGLVEEMGGPHTPAVGWAAGVERLAMLADAPPAPVAPVAVIPVGEAVEAEAVRVLVGLRRAGIRAEMAFRGTLKRRLERANRIAARVAVILGEDELARGVAQVKDLRSGEQAEVPLAALPERLGAA
ncbi:MAG: histidine--tRNA ligase, partial [Elioraea sp.]|nr:histidine--tRNA ligase [Elioraea sp.]